MGNPDYFLPVNALKLLVFLSTLFLATSCAYKWGFGDRALPGGYRELAIPMFENESKEPGLEVDFTNSLINRFERSKVALVRDKDHSPLVLRGTITSVDVARGLGASNIGKLPERAVLSTEYRLTVGADIQLVRQSDQKVIWAGTFSRSKVYMAPRIGTPVVNSANALYNDSIRRETLRNLAQEMMLEAHDRMTESF